MSDLKKLLADAKSATPSAADREARRRSFAYGNTKIENSRITRSIVQDAAKAVDERRSQRAK